MGMERKVRNVGELDGNGAGDGPAARRRSRGGKPGGDQPGGADGRTLAERVEREVAERLVALAAHFSPEDQALVQAVFADGRPAAEVARLSGRTPRSVRARLARLMARVADPVFGWLVVHEGALSPSERRVARSSILEGKPLEDVARECGLTYHEARALRQSVVALARSRLVGGARVSGARRARRASGSTARAAPRARPARAAWRGGEMRGPEADAAKGTRPDDAAEKGGAQ